MQLKTLSVVGGGIHFAIIAITQPFFSLYAAELGASTALIGLMVTLKALLPLFIAMPSGQLIDRLGAPVMLTIGNGVTVASLALMVWSPNLTVLSLSQILVGAGTLLMAASLQVLVSDGEKAERERDIARYSAWSSAGTMIGPVIGGVIITLFAASRLSGEGAMEGQGYRAAFLFSLLLAIVFMMAVLFRTTRTPGARLSVSELGGMLGPKAVLQSYTSGAHLMKHAGVQFGLVSTFLIHYLQAIWMSFFPLYLDTMGYSALVISLLVALRGFASFISRAFLPWIMKGLAQTRILIFAGCIAAISLSILPLFASHVVWVGLISFVLGCAVGVNMPVSTMIMVTDENRGERGRIMGLRLFVNRVSQIVAPAMFGLVGQGIGLGAAFYASGGVLFAAITGFGYWKRSSLQDSPNRKTEAAKEARETLQA
ncbi:MFS transporter [Paenibacillus daejeonensis]|uniref:MFS transporter n=1 Tax=Paenibacillus daejeonensis TaxID=135193 RepID=UPI00037085E6|nr:MFS transporter [Paenibacillus daejeonensis]